ncbi:FUSC family protein [Actinopolyspora xinjiangensis]|uniref:FUSC family protein n=1 Tax=Actinopolyspora xinjiangensis TaxID=405564 RepID=UPI000B868A0C|nr:FUSC family protein [Actinopolyspora xinjiangensis]
MQRLRQELARRAQRLLRSGIPIVQCAISAGIAWLLARHVVGHPEPFFAPIAGVIALGVSLGQRLRRAAELVVGVSVGVGVGDVLISVIGTGAWQIALVVALAMSTAVLLDAGGVIVMQAASSSVLVATLLPPATAGGLNRMVDAAIGGVVGLLVAALLPQNPLAVAHRYGRVVLGSLAEALRGISAAMAGEDSSAASDVLAAARKSHRSVEELRSALATGDEIARFAPIRWRNRADLEHYKVAATPIDRALRNTRVLARRALAALRDEEPVPDAVPGMLEELAGVVVLLRDELADGSEPLRTREAVRAVARRTTVRLVSETDFSMQVVVLQIRSITVDLLQATGLSRSEALDTLPSLHPESDGDSPGPPNERPPE